MHHSINGLISYWKLRDDGDYGGAAEVSVFLDKRQVCEVFQRDSAGCFVENNVGHHLCRQRGGANPSLQYAAISRDPATSMAVSKYSQARRRWREFISPTVIFFCQLLQFNFVLFQQVLSRSHLILHGTIDAVHTTVL